jgi:hypothetical protein
VLHAQINITQLTGFLVVGEFATNLLGSFFQLFG